jgi:2,3,4,5-tetrahydropyridine-2-carboxylate N-succinyltransferase
MKDLAARIEQLFARPAATGYQPDDFLVFEEFKAALNTGKVRAAEPDGGSWRVNTWVKQGILLGFKMGALRDFSIDANFRFIDKSTYPLRRLNLDDGVRVVPGGSSIRDGVYLGRGITCMPPMFINAGAYVDDGTMVDSHALIGSCAQIGKRVHVSAGSQIGGVLEPVGALPVIVEDDVLVGGNCGVYEGTIVRAGAILAAGTVLTGGTPVYDLARETVYRREGDRPLEIPAQAVVVPGSRAISSGWGETQNLSIYTPVIVKYRDSKTETSVRLEELLR